MRPVILISKADLIDQTALVNQLTLLSEKVKELGTQSIYTPLTGKLLIFLEEVTKIGIRYDLRFNYPSDLA